MFVEQLSRIREYELNRVLPCFNAGCRVLEIGAGNGWQARLLSDLGFEVEAIDAAESLLPLVFPVQLYDGATLPFDDKSFDLVFSSNVLEHIPHVDGFQKEMQRVLRPGGRAVHILPSATWRIWSNLTHYIYVSKVAFFMLFPVMRTGDQSEPVNRQIQNRKKYTRPQLLKMFLIPGRHGENGNALSEVYHFSRHRWQALFHKAGWNVKRFPNRLFYTSFSVFGTRLSIPLRRMLSFVLGSACQVYVLRMPGTGP